MYRLHRTSLMMESTIWYSGLSVDVGSGSVLSLAYSASALTPSAPQARSWFGLNAQGLHSTHGQTCAAMRAPMLCTLLTRTIEADPH